MTATYPTYPAGHSHLLTKLTSVEHLLSDEPAEALTHLRAILGGDTSGATLTAMRRASDRDARDRTFDREGTDNPRADAASAVFFACASAWSGHALRLRDFDRDAAHWAADRALGGCGMSEDIPVPKYKLTLTITGNSHDEIERELLLQTRGGYLLDSDYYKRDEWTVYGGTHTSRMEHTNPEQTPENYHAELDAWFQERKAARKA